jgi:hypothetical protein
MPTTQHILIAAFIPISMLLGGPILFLAIGQLPLAVLVPIPLAVLLLFAFMKLVPARCPECGGKAYLKRSRKKRFYYECVKCGIIENKDCSFKT